jgi:hypothetical protein
MKASLVSVVATAEMGGLRRPQKPSCVLCALSSIGTADLNRYDALLNSAD